MCFRTVFALLATISYPSEIGSKFALITFCLFLALTCFMNYANGKHRSSSYSHVFFNYISLSLPLSLFILSEDITGNDI